MKFKQWIVELYIVILFLTGIQVQSIAADNVSHPFVVSGVIINKDNTQLIERFIRHISSLSGYPLHVEYVNTYSDLSRILREEPDALGWTCGAPFVQDSQGDGQQLIAVPLFNKKPVYNSLILTANKRAEKSLADFKAGVLAFSDPRSNSGFLSPKYALFQQGIDIDRHFRLLLNTGNHENSIEALLGGLADVAAIDEYVWVAYIRHHPDAKNKLKEIERMGPFPFTPIVAGKKIDKKTLNNIRAQLVNMNQNNEGRKLLADFHLDGFVEKEKEFYQPIKNMLEKVKINSGK